MKPLTSGTTAALGRQGLAAVCAASALVVAALLTLALVRDPASLLARLEALRSLSIAGPAIVGSVAGVASLAVGAHGARHIGGPPAPTNPELVAEASSTTTEPS